MRYLILSMILLGGTAFAAQEPPDPGVGPPDLIAQVAHQGAQSAVADLCLFDLPFFEAHAEGFPGEGPALAKPALILSPEDPDPAPLEVVACPEAISQKPLSLEREPFALGRRGPEIASTFDSPSLAPVLASLPTHLTRAHSSGDRRAGA